jgi:Nucleotidyltransferase domain
MAHPRTTADLPDSARFAMSRIGMDLDELIPAIGAGPDAAVLLVGSHATGWASADSDLDFAILLEGDEKYASPATDSDLAMATPIVERHLAMAGTLEVDVEVVKAEPLSVLVAGIHELDKLGSMPSAAFAHFPILQDVELRIMERLRSGIVLTGAGRVSRWRTSLGTDKLPLYATLTNYLGAMASLEDSAALLRPGQSALGAAISGRAAAERLVFSALAYYGHIVIELRHAEELSARSAADGGEVPPILTDLRGMLFPDPGTVHEYFDRVYGHAVELFRFYGNSDRYPGLAQGISWFGRDRWRVDTSFLRDGQR